MRTSTHAFNIPVTANTMNTPSTTTVNTKKGWGRQVLRNRINHHGHHGRESTGGVLLRVKKAILFYGCKDIWGDTDVYGVTKLEGDSDPILLGQY